MFLRLISLMLILICQTSQSFAADETQEVMVARILQNLHSDEPRLKYAAWLRSKGQIDRAELIEVQIEIFRMRQENDWDGLSQGDAVKLDKLRERERVLYETHGESWWGQSPAPANFARGFLGAFKFIGDGFLGSVDDIVDEHVPFLERIEILETLEVSDVLALNSSRRISQIRDFVFNKVEPEAIPFLNEMFENGKFKQAESIEFRYGGFDTKTLEHLGKSGGLRRLTLTRPKGFSDSEIRFVSGRDFPALTHLELASGVQQPSIQYESILSSVFMKNLISLRLNWNSDKSGNFIWSEKFAGFKRLKYLLADQVFIKKVKSFSPNDSVVFSSRIDGESLISTALCENVGNAISRIPAAY